MKNIVIFINNSFAEWIERLVYLSDLQSNHAPGGFFEDQPPKDYHRKFFFFFSAKNQSASFTHRLFSGFFLVWHIKDDGA